MSDIKINGKCDSQESSHFLPSSLPRYGLPATAAEVDDSPLDTDEPSLVYRAFTVGSSKASLLRTAATLSKERVVTGVPTMTLIDRKPQPPAVEAVTIRYVDTERPLSFTHVLIPLADADVLKSINSFLSSSGISSEKRHPQVKYLFHFMSHLLIPFIQ